MKRYHVSENIYEDVNGRWVKWEDVQAYGTMKVFNEQRDIIDIYEKRIIDLQRTFDTTYDMLVGANKHIAELEAEIADIKENQFPKRIGKITQDVRKQTAQDIIQYIVDQSTVGIMAGHDAFFVDTTDIMILKERYGV